MTLVAVANGQLSDASQVDQYRDLFNGGLFWDAKNIQGLATNNTGDQAAGLSAIMTAAGTNGIVVLGPGTYRIPTSGRSAITPPDGLRLVGMGRQTVLQTESALTADGSMFLVSANNKFFIENLSFVGPSSPAGFVSRGVNHAGTSGEVHARNIYVSNLTNFLRADIGSVWLDCTDCDVSTAGASGVGGSGILHNGDQTGARATVSRTIFRQYGVSGTNQEHALYGKVGCAMDVGDCFFLNNAGTGYAIQSFGGTGTPDSWIVHDSYFGPGTYHGIVTPATKRTLIHHCVFANDVDPGTGLVTFGIRNQFESDISDCHFNMTRISVGETIPLNGYTANVKAWVKGCTFLLADSPISTGGNTGTVWYVSNCRMPNLAAATSIFQAGGSPTIWAEANEYSNTVAPGSSLTANRPGGYGTGSRWFDTTLNKPIWRDAVNANWRDASGAIV